MTSLRNATYAALNWFGLYTRAQVELAKRNSPPGFAAAAINRLTNDWATSTLSADAKTRWSLETLRARSRIVADDDAYGKKFVRMLKTNVLGSSGFNLRVKARFAGKFREGKFIPGPLDAFANQTISDSFWEWGKKGNCTVTRDQSWCDVQKLILGTACVDGECLIRKVVRFKNDHRYALQILESDYLDHNKNETLPNGNEIRMGVEVNEWREKIAYWLFKTNPHDQFFTHATYTGSKYHYRVPADEIIHAGIQERPEQTRFNPWMTTGMKRLKMLDGYEEAILVNKRVTASKMGFFEQEGDSQYSGDEDALGNKMMDAEPGSFELLPKGLKLSAWSPSDTDPNSAMFIKSNLRGIAAAFGVSYNSLANDMESVNFASGQLGMEEERDVFKDIQNWMIEHICNNIFRSWLDTQLTFKLLGQLPYEKLDKFDQPEWRGRRWKPVNVQQYWAAVKERLALRATTLGRVLAEEGEDFDETIQEIADEKEKMDALGILPAEIFPPSPEEVAAMADDGAVKPNA